jgi:hypothetical protein
VNKILGVFGVSAAAVALTLFAVGAQAQKAPAAKAPPKCTTVKQQADCEGRADCSWVAETKDAKGKVKAKAYCRAKPKAPAKK